MLRVLTDILVAKEIELSEHFILKLCLFFFQVILHLKSRLKEYSVAGSQFSH